MNTKQKLTLGIAAIFMVTLTIIGVTYAYFVTRVNYTGTETTAIIKTAEIGSSITIDAPVTLENALPGATAWKTFAINTGSDADVPFAIKITTSLNVDEADRLEHVDEPGWTPNVDEHAYPEFVHTLQADGTTTATGVTPGFTANSVCYVQDVPVGQDAADCYKGARYDNIELTLYRVHSNQSVVKEGSLYYADRVYGLDLSGASTDSAKISAINGYTNFYEKVTLDSGQSYFQKFAGEIFNDESDETIVYKGTSPSQYEVGRNVVLSRKGSDGNVEFSVGASVVYDESITPAQGVLPVYARGIKAPYNKSFIASGNAINLGGTQVVKEKKEKIETTDDEPGNSYNLYVLKVTYKNLNINQNIENNASVNIKIDITGDATVSQ